MHGNFVVFTGLEYWNMIVGGYTIHSDMNLKANVHIGF